MLIELAIRRMENDDQSCEGHLSNLVLSADVEPSLDALLEFAQNMWQARMLGAAVAAFIPCFLETLSAYRTDCGDVHELSTGNNFDGCGPGLFQFAVNPR